MYFRELNTYINIFTADLDACAERLWEWCRQKENVLVIDLAKAYLQIRIHDSLWAYQTLIYKGQQFCLTRLGFGPHDENSAELLPITRSSCEDGDVSLH